MVEEKTTCEVTSSNRDKIANILVVIAVALTITGAFVWVFTRPTGGVEIILPVPSPIVAEIAGQVHNPGVYELPPHARLKDLVDISGGFTKKADMRLLNMASMLKDGQKVVINEISTTDLQGTTDGNRTESSPNTPSTNEEKPTQTLIDLNTATSEELETLPNIGPALAERIIRWREENGPIQNLEQLLEVSGIGAATLEQLHEYVIQPSATAEDNTASLPNTSGMTDEKLSLEDTLEQLVLKHEEPYQSLLDLNIAASEELETLPNIGPALAKRIIKWREEKGHIESLNQLQEVSGIGSHILEQIREYVIQPFETDEGDTELPPADLEIDDEKPLQTPTDLNTATLEQLKLLPGIGPTLAERIIKWRAKNGHIKSLNQLQGVSGIGSHTLEQIREYVIQPFETDEDDRKSSPKNQRSSHTPVDLNIATLEELDTLPSIGPSLANQIINWREQHGPIQNLEQLDDVPGIGPSTLEKISGYVTQKFEPQNVDTETPTEPPETKGQEDTQTLIDLNTATLEELNTLPGIGPSLANQIINWREQHGHIQNLEQLDDVPGIGPSTLEKISGYVTQKFEPQNVDTETPTEPPETKGQEDTQTLIDLNTATFEELNTLPGIGPSLANQIINWREQHGHIQNLEQLDDVPGIGPSTLEKISGYVTQKFEPQNVDTETPTEPPETKGQEDTQTLIDLNTATLEELDTLPGIGPSLANKIINWREQHGHIQNLEQLDDVPGIGPSTLEKISGYVTQKFEPQNVDTETPTEPSETKGQEDTQTLIDLNTATLEELDTLPGIGPSLANKIINWREQHGHIQNLEQLDDVPGIGPSTLEKINGYVTQKFGKKDKDNSPTTENPNPQNQDTSTPSESTNTENQDNSPTTENPNPQNQDTSTPSESTNTENQDNSPTTENPNPQNQDTSTPSESTNTENQDNSPTTENPNPQNQDTSTPSESTNTENQDNSPTTENPNPQNQDTSTPSESTNTENQDNSPTTENPNPQNQDTSTPSEPTNTENQDNSPTTENPNPQNQDTSTPSEPTNTENQDNSPTTENPNPQNQDTSTPSEPAIPESEDTGEEEIKSHPESGGAEDEQVPDIEPATSANT